MNSAINERNEEADFHFKQGYSDGYKDGFNKLLEETIKSNQLEIKPIILEFPRPSDAQPGEWPKKKESNESLFDLGWNRCHDAFMKVIVSGQKERLRDLIAAHWNMIRNRAKAIVQRFSRPALSEKRLDNDK